MQAWNNGWPQWQTERGQFQKAHSSVERDLAAAREESIGGESEELLEELRKALPLVKDTLQEAQELFAEGENPENTTSPSKGSEKSLTVRSNETPAPMVRERDLTAHLNDTTALWDPIFDRFGDTKRNLAAAFESPGTRDDIAQGGVPQNEAGSCEVRPAHLLT